MVDGYAGRGGGLRKFVHRMPLIRRALARSVRWGSRAAARVNMKEPWVLAMHRIRRLSAEDGPSTRFVIYGQGRSGSSVLLDLIASHPAVYCDSEVFNRKVAGRLRKPWEYLHARASFSPKPAYGCKLKIYQMTEDQEIQDPRRFMLDLHEAGWKVIHLVRMNLFRKALSLVVAETRGQFLDRKSDGSGLDSITVDPQRLEEALRERQRADDREERALEGIPHIRVTYETDLLDEAEHQEVANRVFAYLGLESAPVQTRYTRTSRGSASDYIANFSEICKHLRRTEFAGFLPVEDSA